MSRFFFFDTETTGFPLDRRAPYTNARNWPRMVQLAWAVYGEDGREASAEEHLIRPEGFAIPADAFRVHGITTERARAEGLLLAGVLGRFLAGLDGEGPSVALVTHNLDFDRNVLAAELHRLGHPRPEIEQALFRKPAHCTMQESAAHCRIPGARGQFKWPTLEQLHRKLFGKGIQRAHTALADVRACARCFFRLRELGVMG